MVPIGLHCEVIRAVEKFANLAEFERDDIDRLFREAFLRELPEIDQQAAKAVEDRYVKGGVLLFLLSDLLTSENRAREKFTRVDRDALRLRFITSSLDTVPMPPYSPKDLMKGRVIPPGFLNDYHDQQQELRRWLGLLQDRRKLRKNENLRIHQAIMNMEGVATITPSGVLVSFAITTVEAAWVFAIHELIENKSEHKIGRCSAPKRWGSSGEICGNFIIDVSARGRRPRKFCSKRCGTRQHVRNKRKEAPGLGGAI